MKQAFFVHNGKQYNSGTDIVIRWFCCASRSLCDTNAKFLYYDTDKKQYYVEIYGREYSYSEERFRDNFRKIRGEIVYHHVHVDKTPKASTFSDEFSIKDLKIAWVLYILAMLISVVFYERIFAWIFVSLVFFSYRRKMLKEYGYK